MTPHIALASYGALILSVALVLELTGTSPLTLFGDAGTMAAFAFLFAYFMISVAAPFYMRKLGELRRRNIAVAVLAFICLMVPTVGSFYPAPPSPVNLFPYLFLGFMLIGGARLYWMHRTQPEALTGIQRELERALAAASTALGSPPAVVTALATTPVKGLRICAREEVMLERGGVTENRRFYLIDERARMVNGKRIGILSAVRADLDSDTERLTMSFPDGMQVSSIVQVGEALETRFFSRRPQARVVTGPWSQALSEYTGTQLRLVQADPAEGGVDRGLAGAVSLISEASVARLEAVAGGREVDTRRFRMLIEVSGPQAHGEDEWVGRTARIGEARVGFRGHVGRCLVTSQDPDTGIVDLPTLELPSYRRGAATSEPLAFGVFGEVLEPGLLRLGDGVIPE
jgi:hypothetical protein